MKYENFSYYDIAQLQHITNTAAEVLERIIYNGGADCYECDNLLEVIYLAGSIVDYGESEYSRLEQKIGLARHASAAKS